MWNLDLRKYSPVYLKRTPISPWIVEGDALPLLKESAGFIKSLIQSYPNKSPGTLSWIMQEFSRSTDPSEEILSYLGLKTIGTLPGEFIDEAQYKNWLASAELALPTERFYSKPFLSLGSSRHVLLQNVQLKGVGRNNLCLDEDFYHSWGGLVTRDALKGYLSSLVANRKTKLGSLPIHGIFNYQECPAGSPPLSLVVRSSRSFRLCQLDANFITDTDISVLRDFLRSQFQGNSPQEMLELITDHYIHAYSVGVVHRSPNRENLLLDGRWIDTESIDFKIENAPLYSYLKIFIPCSDKEIVEGFGKSLNQVLDLNHSVHFFDSWIHHLYLMTELTHEAFKVLWTDQITDSMEYFWELMQKYFPERRIPVWRKDLSHFVSFNQMSFTRRTNDKLELVSSDLTVFADSSEFKCIGQYFDYSLGGVVLTFADADEDIHQSVGRLLRKWEVNFWPKGEGLEDAMANARVCSRAIEEMIP